MARGKLKNLSQHRQTTTDENRGRIIDLDKIIFGCSYQYFPENFLKKLYLQLKSEYQMTIDESNSATTKFESHLIDGFELQQFDNFDDFQSFSTCQSYNHLKQLLEKLAKEKHCDNIAQIVHDNDDNEPEPTWLSNGFYRTQNSSTPTPQRKRSRTSSDSDDAIIIDHFQTTKRAKALSKSMNIAQNSASSSGSQNNKQMIITKNLQSAKLFSRITPFGWRTFLKTDNQQSTIFELMHIENIANDCIVYVDQFEKMNPQSSNDNETNGIQTKKWQQFPLYKIPFLNHLQQHDNQFKFYNNPMPSLVSLAMKKTAKEFAGKSARFLNILQRFYDLQYERRFRNEMLKRQSMAEKSIIKPRFGSNGQIELIPTQNDQIIMRNGDKTTSTFPFILNNASDEMNAKCINYKSLMISKIPLVSIKAQNQSRQTTLFIINDCNIWMHGKYTLLIAIICLYYLTCFILAQRIMTIFPKSLNHHVEPID
ncbi:hypothetical protein DERP_009528 [Dermatophagoides pteronyssinus]|uniref:Uncharacterized protein n=1 Tax=Dermatophagoides pteronyssinus TaxID=6956 RepID=A0ABQ8IUD9_DERPT|nr:hypothetical protein DERP_009528 [Dermatophagoides pteronyssinus]